MQTRVTLIGFRGDSIDLAGATAGAGGFYLAEGGFDGLYDPPIKTDWEEPGNFPGARFQNARYLRRDFLLKVAIPKNTGINVKQKETQLRKMISAWRESIIEVESDDGVRQIVFREKESPTIDLTVDIDNQQWVEITYLCASGDPFYYGEEEHIQLFTTTDTTASGTEDLVFTLDSSTPLNPTGLMVYPRWYFEAPASGQTIGIVLPDYSFPDDYFYYNPDHAAREITLPDLLFADGDLLIDADRSRPVALTGNETAYAARMNMVRPRYGFPEYTDDATLTVTVSGAPIGYEVSLYIDRPWTRPWGDV